ncbi:MAG: transglutaminase domain-containing protein [Mariniblastus sp.]|nr:transglutaminase domain-containing protein [Mariniblastus sp.]
MFVQLGMKWLIVLLVSAAGTPLAVAQLHESGASLNVEDELGPRLGETHVTYWEFGLKIKSNGQSSGITATVPVPVDWPEQIVEVIKEKKTDNVRRLSYNNLAKPMKQLVIKANRLDDGEVAQASVVFRVAKRFIESPEDPQRLQFSNSIPVNLKQYLRPSPYIESNDPKLKAIAKREFSFGDDVSDYDTVERIYTWVRDKVEYEFDPVIHECLEALESGKGDCEELSSLMIAFCRIKNIPARAVWIPGHTYPEFYLEDKKGTGHWVPCQAAGDYCFGAMPEMRPILQKGDKFKVPGSKKPLRYVQPMLTAKDATGGLSIEWIGRQLTEEEVERLLDQN